MNMFLLGIDGLPRLDVAAICQFRCDASQSAVVENRHTGSDEIRVAGSLIRRLGLNCDG